MAKNNIDQRVDRALQALIAPRENSVRALAQALDHITQMDAKIRELNEQRDRAIDLAQQAAADAKTAGWKPKELTAAGLTVPRRRTTPTDSTQ